jgi:hypothetical protein
MEMAKRGRPPKSQTDRKSVSIGARVTASLHDELIAAATDSGRKVSQEIEARLRLSFGDQQRRIEEFGGPMNYWFCRALSRGFSRTEAASGHRWWDDRPTFEVCAAFLAAAMERLKPSDKKIGKGALRDAKINGEELAQDMLFKLKMALRGEGEDLGPEIFNIAGTVGTKMTFFSPRDSIEFMRRQGLINTDEEAKSILNKFKRHGLDKRKK